VRARLIVAALVVGGMAHAAAAQPTDAVRIAYPEEPVAWHAALSELPATVDLAALWGLPLYRIDHHGQLRAGLAASATVHPGEPWTVELTLRRGTWSDGRAVVASDVVATVDAIRDVAGDDALGPLESVTAVDDRTVRIAFERPYARWPYLLAGGWSVLPAHVLADHGLDAYRDSVPVSGGPYHLDSYEPALRAVFVARAGSPLGEPELERIEVLFTPSYETALGLIRDQRADVAAGYVALTGEERARRVEGVRASAVRGGTWTLIRWEDGGSVGRDADRVRVARGRLGMGGFVEGLLGRYGAPMTSLLPGVDGRWEPRPEATGGLDDEEIHLLLSGTYEVIGVTGRVLQGALRGAGAEVVLVRVDHDDEYEGRVDGAFVLRRDLPRPSLVARAPAGLGEEELATLLAADADDHGAVEAALDLLHEAGMERPLYEIAISHAWREDLHGVRPSAWPGVGFWDVTRWRWAE
jgi:hypothetical protein